MYSTNPPLPGYSWASGWEKCAKIEDLWGKTEAARRLKERQEQEKRDQEFIDQVIKDNEK